MKNNNLAASLLIFLIHLISHAQISHAQACSPSGEIQGSSPPPGGCKQENGAECCVQDKSYTTYECSPPVTGNTMATLTLNSFEEGGDGGGPPACDNQHHNDDTPVVALSTGWYNGGSRCGNKISISLSANGPSVDAMVVDECDSTRGCDEEHAYQPPCRNNIVDASKAVWEALGLDENAGKFDITWTDA